MAKLVSAATGIDYTWEDILTVGERIYAVEYALQRRFGLGKDSDEPPVRFFEEKSKSGFVLDREKFETSRSQYYEIRGYDKSGVPTAEKLKELGLEDVNEDLRKRKVAEHLVQKTAS
jgi:aldehyde:ferredoxin oxidoreductase